MGKIIFWDKRKERYLVDNYGQLSNKFIAVYIGTTPRKVVRKACYLRNKGEPVKCYPMVKWKDPKIKEMFLENYGSLPTHELATRFQTTIGAVYRTASRLGAIFRGSEGRYTTTELAKLLGINEKTLTRWTKIGLRISAHAKDGLTRPRKPMASLRPPRYFCGLISLDDLKKFLIQKPEAYDLRRLTDETKFILELDQIKVTWKWKKVFCKVCRLHFWARIHNNHPRCSKCGRIVSKWAEDYR